ncbi:uncharacterized protein LOC118459348 [Anopheles albimanus]|uniref:uncharacterized protein LOC118459348 n=1 Tax=Anopheles albimanus TaxID=7167 RepID=UPI001641AC16|nr:uncharacterized protein LOC118459348 [Anopheles albimanus]XP_035778520.1 uncharacterized protein LOC118459348 [Anopheles albimanus]XP_035778521.1 uncharacterized protein LOC118459348 [Anopheles albimanus]XP_035778522.1 uncharacterized protein LOC118459348 [Anopheles albimanus]XP_035778523.1 uncharacterized protein LOC118459348 [Anopheles albimanus]
MCSTSGRTFTSATATTTSTSIAVLGVLVVLLALATDRSLCSALHPTNNSSNTVTNDLPVNASSDSNSSSSSSSSSSSGRSSTSTISSNSVDGETTTTPVLPPEPPQGGSKMGSRAGARLKDGYGWPTPEGGQIPLERLPSNTLLKYTAYKDVSILHFRIPTDTRTALFSFKAYEESKGAFQRNCKPNDITLHLKAGSYPVISPENITFPKHFLDADERFEIHSLQFKSDSSTRRLSIEGPHPGNWFAVAFISWTDPNNERIEQQGLAASCETLLMSEMAVVRVTPQILHVGMRHPGTLALPVRESAAQNQSEPNTYKFFVPAGVAIVTWRLHITDACLNCTDVTFFVQAHGLPTGRDYLQNALICPNQTGDVSIDFYPHESAWHYVDLDFLRPDEKLAQALTGKNSTATVAPPPANRSLDDGSEQEVEYLRFTIELIYHMLDDDGSSSDRTNNELPPSVEPTQTDGMGGEVAKSLPSRTFDRYPVLRQTYREFFMFDYDLLPDVNGTVPVTLNLTSGTPALMKFDVNDVYDIGGTLSFAVAMRQDLKASLIDARHQESTNEHAGVVAEKLVDVQEEEFIPELPVTMTTASTTTTTTSNAASTTTASTMATHHDTPSDQRGSPSSSSSSASGHASANSSAGKANQTVIVCLRLEEPGIPTWPDKCVYGRHIYPAAIVINNTDADTNTGLVHVPFPEPGSWYVTLGLFCHGPDLTARTTIIDSVKDFIRTYRGSLEAMRSPCSCADRLAYYRTCVSDERCLGALNETETLKIKECLMDAKCSGSTAQSERMARRFELHHKYVTEQSVSGGTVGNPECNSSVVFTISSSPCVAGRCGRFGRCYHYMSGGFVFSTCLCLRNYRGWDCTEDSQVPSSASILLASLLLTLSNLLFLPSIYYAVRRGYHSEAIIYFFAMFFSAFYHACDSGEEEFSFCLVKIGVLQFCDFYCGLLAIWVTLIAMSNVRHQLVSLLHVLGAILLAFGTELNKQSLWVFLAPALTGICLISVSWGLRCRKTKRCFPSRNYLALYLPVGSVLVMVGLVCFAFLQTKQNYHIVHSIWHMVMALSILCLLPDRKTFHPKC